MTFRNIVERVLGSVPVTKSPSSRFKRMGELVEKAMAKASDKEGATKDMLTVAALIAVGRFLCEQLDALEADMKASPLSYEGVYESGKVYGKGAFVTYGGSLFHCNYKTGTSPGDGNAWTLAVKRGKDAK